MIDIDTTRLYAVRPPKHFNNCKVIDLDPLSVGAGVVPRLIAVQMPDIDGATMHAMYHGSPTIALNDFVRCRRDTADTNILVVEGYGGGTGSSSTSGGVWPAPDKLMIGSTEYGTVAAAIAAASSGNLIKIGEGTFTCDDETLPAGVDMLGSGRGVTVLQTTGQLDCLTIGGTSIIRNLSVKNTFNSASDSQAIKLTSASNLTAVDIVVSITNTGGGTGTALSIQDGTAELVDCFVDSDDVSLGTFGGSTGATIAIYGGKYNGTGTDLAAQVAGDTVDLQGPELTNNSLILTGTVRGFFYTGAGKAGFAPTTNVVSEISTDGTLAGNSDDAVPTEKAIKTYVDGLDGDKLDIDWNPSNYTPDSSITEADDVDDLSAHLKGIDDILVNVDNFRGIDVQLSADQGSILNNTDTKVQLDTENIDTEGDYDNATNYRHTPSIAGKWLYIWTLRVDSGSAAIYQAKIFKNGAVDRTGQDSGGAGSGTQAIITAIIDMNGTTDYVEFYVRHATGSTQSVIAGAQTFAQAIYLGA